MEKTLFEKIIDREIPAEIVWENSQALVFKDINPQAPIHLLIVPKIVIEKIALAQKEHQALLGELLLIAGEVARDLGVEEDFRLVVNNGALAGQTVFHLHIHFMAGREFTWPAG